MSFALTRADRSLVATGVGVFVLLLLLALLLTPSGDGEQSTSYSAGSGGTKAAYLLLEASGYHVDRWRRPPAELTDASATTLILTEPFVAALDDRNAILRFADAGGRIIVTGGTGSWLVGARGRPDPVGALGWERASAVALSAITRAAPSITIAPATRIEANADGEPLYAVGAAPVVLRFRRANGGDISWWAATTPLANAGITAPGNLPFVLASVGPPDGRRVLFDEYFHGYRESLVASAMLTPLKWALVQCAVLAVVIVATRSRRSGPILPAVSETRLSPLEFVRTLGTLYRRAGAGPLAVAAAYSQFRARLSERLGIASSVAAPAAAETAAARRAVDRDRLAATMQACEAAREQAVLGDAAALALVQDLHARGAELGVYPPVKESH